MRTDFDDGESEFSLLAGKRMVITRPVDLLEGDWVEARESSIASMTVSWKPDDSEVRLADGQSFIFYEGDRLVIYRCE